MTSETSHAHDDGHGDDHHDYPAFSHPAPVRTLLGTFGALVLLTIITVGLAAAFEMGRFEVWVSLGIATVKATLVICFFMHMLHDKPLNALVFLSSLFFVALFIGITLMDTDQYQEDIRAMDESDRPQVIEAADAAQE